MCRPQMGTLAEAAPNSGRGADRVPGRLAWPLWSVRVSSHQREAEWDLAGQ